MKEEKKNEAVRPPVITVMGHIDHGKSTLLDYIRKTNIVEKEAGGITQHLSAYEVVHESKDGHEHRITFLDTPGHEAFGAIRARGAKVADLAILIVSADDGVKPQTLEAVRVLNEAKIPFVVAINKIDKPGASVDSVKQSLAENNIYLEGFGGNTSWAAISAKTGEGVPELLDLLLLAAELEDLKGDPSQNASGIVIESNVDTKKGISATVIIKNGTLRRGMYAVCGESLAPLRIVEDFLGKSVEVATFSSPIRIIGWDKQPKVGEKFVTVENKKEAVALASENSEKEKDKKDSTHEEETQKEIIPLIIKTDTAGSLDALLYEISKLENERIVPKVVLSGLGSITENDIRTAESKENTLVIAFHTGIDSRAENLALRSGITINKFDIIYKLTEWLVEALKERTPTQQVEEVVGEAKILKFFSRMKDKQIVGGRCETGEMLVNEQVKIMRRESEIGRGRIRELQVQKEKTSRVEEGAEFGSMIEAKIEIAPGDKIHCFKIVNK